MDQESSPNKLPPPTNMSRNIEPQSLAERLAAKGNRCPIPFTHDRLYETHHWWHEMARNYHEPDPFRYSLGAFIQAARSVTYMLQNEQVAFPSFDWYRAWAVRAREDTLLRWVNAARPEFVHRQALEPRSWLEMRCLGNPRSPHGTDDDPLMLNVSPFACTHHYMRGEIKTDHGHEFTRYWGIDALQDAELLEACAGVYDRLDALVHDAHERAGRPFPRTRWMVGERCLAWSTS
jgi:hypothetical protein